MKEEVTFMAKKNNRTMAVYESLTAFSYYDEDYEDIVWQLSENFIFATCPVGSKSYRNLMMSFGYKVVD